MENNKIENFQALYRGKRKDNGQWITGSLVTNLFYNDETKDTLMYIITNDLELDITTWDELSSGHGIYEVIPETVGQCLKYKDSFGNYIFEGDIIRDQNYGPEIYGHVDFDRIYDDSLEHPIPLYSLQTDLDNYKVSCEIIGNIQDNPELIK